MVETRTVPDASLHHPSAGARARIFQRRWSPTGRHLVVRASFVMMLLLVGVAWVLVPSGAQTPRASLPRAAEPAHDARSTGEQGSPTAPPAVVSPVAVPVPVTTPPTVPVTATAAVTAPATVAALPASPSVATLVARVETAGIEPGANWNWSMGDTATQCGVIAGQGTGCTFGAAGLEHSVFAGSPTLALVAHELANAETQNDAVPALLSDVAAADGGTSWSPTDAVASCLVAHFMGFQDDAAGTWQCPAPLAAVVAANIHDTLSATIEVGPG
jgi:hypothetical protein